MVTKEYIHQKECYCISNDQIKLYINPADGMNLYDIWHHNQPLVQFDPDRYEANKTCSIMTLFPTPNRIRDNRFEFEGITYPMDNHGIVKHAPFQLDFITETKEGGVLKASLHLLNSLDIEDEYYRLFPFLCTLTIEIELYQNQITYRYQLVNNDHKNLPYGIAIHPFFHKPQKEEVTIQVFASTMMECDTFRLPTGRILPVTPSNDLRTPKKVDDLALDDVYLVHSQDIAAVIYYQDKKVLLSSSPEFEKLVVYTPQNCPYFCLENQTCSTDAINLYHQGFEKESSLLILKPQECKEGFITFSISET